MPLQAGERLGAFEILTVIGSGGMGDVYRVRHEAEPGGRDQDTPD
jgi:serine/threonine protein kinase